MPRRRKRIFSGFLRGEMADMIHVKVDQLFLSNMGFVVLLKAPEDERSLPIFIGAAEAQAIALQLNGIEPPRPMTHDLFKCVLDLLECRLMRIEVCGLDKGTFLAKLILDLDGEQMEIDSRPSDAIAMALRFVAPVYVARQVMDEAGRVLDVSEQGGEAAKPDGDTEPETATAPLSKLEVLRQQLAKAVDDERYEDAAGLRDDIKRLESEHQDN